MLQIEHCKYILNSCPIYGRVERWDETRRSPFMEGSWLSRMLADHAWRTITGADKIKWMRWVWRNGGMKFMVGDNWRNSEKNLPRLHFIPYETHVEWPRRELGTTALGGERLIVCATEPPMLRHYLPAISMVTQVGNINFWTLTLVILVLSFSVNFWKNEIVCDSSLFMLKAHYCYRSTSSSWILIWVNYLRFIWNFLLALH